MSEMLIDNVLVCIKIENTIGLPPLPITVIDACETCNTTIKSITVDYGDGVIANMIPGTSVWHEYIIPGEYSITVNVVDENDKTYSTVYDKVIYVVGINVVLPSDMLLDEKVVEVSKGSFAKVSRYRSKNEYGGEFIKEITTPIDIDSTTIIGPTVNDRLNALEDAVLQIMGV